MEERNQFTFYRSFWDAVRGLPKRDRLPILEAIIGYALDGVMPEGLQQSQEAFFMLCKPNLDASRKRAAAGQIGGSKPKANRKQTEREKEIETEKEIEKEYESKEEAGFESFWHLYPRKEGKLKAREAYIRAGVEEKVLLDALRKQLSCEQWQRDGGRFIPLPATWLNQRRWEDEPTHLDTGRKPDAQEIAAVRRLMQDG